MVIGLPVNMDGSEGPRAQASRAFVRNMARLTDLPFVFWDERLSTVAAERTLIEMDVSRAKRATRIDSAAAAFILQGVLDRLQTLLGFAPSSSHRGSKLGVARIAVRRSGPSRHGPGRKLAPAAERPDRGDHSTPSKMQACATIAGIDRRVDAEDLAVQLEDEVVHLARQHDVAEIHVVERQEEPAPEQQQRRCPEARRCTS